MMLCTEMEPILIRCRRQSLNRLLIRQAVIRPKRISNIVRFVSRMLAHLAYLQLLHALRPRR